MTILLSSAVTNKVSVTSVSNVRRRYIGSARVIHSFTTEFCTKRQENTYLSGCVDIVQTAILDAANTSVMLGLQNNREKKGRRNSSSYATRQRNDRARMYVTHYEASEPKHRMRRYKSLLQVEMCIAFEWVTDNRASSTSASPFFENSRRANHVTARNSQIRMFPWANTCRPTTYRGY